MRLIPYVRMSEPPAQFGPQTSSLFEGFFNDFPLFSPAIRSGDQYRPSVDILEKDGSLILRAEVPGMNEKDIDLKLEGNILTIKGEKKLDHEEDRDNYHRMESFFGSFSRSFTLPDSVDRDQIKADYKNGILTVTIPQKPEVKAREIPVSTN